MQQKVRERESMSGPDKGDIGKRQRCFRMWMGFPESMQGSVSICGFKRERNSWKEISNERVPENVGL